MTCCRRLPGQQASVPSGKTVVCWIGYSRRAGRPVIDVVRKKLIRRRVRGASRFAQGRDISSVAEPQWHSVASLHLHWGGGSSIACSGHAVASQGGLWHTVTGHKSSATGVEAQARCALGTSASQAMRAHCSTSGIGEGFTGSGGGSGAISGGAKLSGTRALQIVRRIVVVQ